MDFGWYRTGRGPLDELGRMTWDFHKGHLLDSRTQPPLWFTARDEQAAMRLLLGQLHARSMRPRERRWRPPLSLASAQDAGATAD